VTNAPKGNLNRPVSGTEVCCW